MKKFFRLCILSCLGLFLGFDGAISTIGAVEPAVINLGARFGGATSTDRKTPLWLNANRDGRFQDEQYQGYASVDMSYEQAYTSFWRGFAALEVQRDVSSGDDELLRLPQAYAGIYGGPFVLHVGRYPLRLGDVTFPELSSGSLSVSNNAVPIPRITGRTDGYIDVPGLDGIVQTKFGLSHGWFEEDRSTANALLHEKWLYLRLSHEDKMSLWGGLVHQAMWGGTAPDGEKLPSTLDDYFRVFSGSSGGDDASLSDQINRAGDAFGIWDMGFSAEIKGATLTGYYQHYYEVISNFRLWSNGLDGLKGVTLELPHAMRVVPKTLLYERIRTDYQGGPLHDAEGYDLFGRNSYFRNSAYQSGWTYLGQVVGTPLVLTTGSGDDLRFSSNRIKANHFGVGGELTDTISYRLLYSAVRHRFPSYSEESVHVHGTYWQYDGLLELIAHQPFGLESMEISVGAAVSTGDMFGTSYGGNVQVRFELY